MKTDSLIGQCIAAHLLKDKSTVDDEVLLDWLAESEDNQQTFHEYQKIWKETRKISGMKQFDAEFAWEKVNEVNRQKAIFRRRIKNIAYTISGMAASILLLITFNLTGFVQRPFTEMAVEMKTDYGDRSAVVLPDGSNVKLNVGSQIAYSYNQKKKIREVKFQGEGFFEIAKNNIPFLITVPGDLQVKVLGTTFNLSAYENDTTALISLIEGSVELSRDEQKLRLIPGQIVIYDKTTKQMRYSNGNLAHTYAWLNNKLYMENMSLADVCKYLERWYDVQITVEKNIGETIYYSGVLKEETINDVLDALSKISKIKYRVKGRNINIYAKNS
jgi:ferric-dicitrate binding protein FerR (iron transport regulator)